MSRDAAITAAVACVLHANRYRLQSTLPDATLDDPILLNVAREIVAEVRKADALFEAAQR